MNDRMCETDALRYQERQADEWRDRAFAALESLKMANDNTEALRAFLTQMLDPAWWREEVDVNGEYTTTRERGYYDCAREIRAALGEAGS